MIEFSSLITSMDEIKRLHRENTWIILPDKYNTLRKSLISVKTSYPNLSDKQQKQLQSAIQNLTSMEGQVEIALISKKEPQNIAKLNSTITKKSDELYEILMEIKNQIGK